MSMYKKNPQEYINQTKNVDMRHVYAQLESYLKPNSTIWDVGCGSGRDSIYFHNRGYKVIASDYSQEMVDIIKKQVPFQVLVDDMRNSQIHDKFDAIWACSSLLHLKKQELTAFFKHMFNNLNKNGVVYCSFKKGENEREKFDLIFQDFTIDLFSQYMNELQLFSIETSFETKDSLSNLRPDWVNFILKKNS